MLKDNKSLLTKYENERRDDGISEKTIHYQHNFLKNLDKHLKKPFKDATEDDIRDFIIKYSGASKDTVKGVIRPFYKWIFDIEHGDKLPDCICWIRFRSKRQKNREEDNDYRERIVTEEEYQRLLNAAVQTKHKAILETMYFYGVRVGELCSINADGVQDKGEEVLITVRDSKTKKRRVPYIGYPQHLMEWYALHPYKGEKNIPLWISRKIDKDGNFKRMTESGVYHLLQRLRKYAGIERRITDHDFRHTAIARDTARGMPEMHLCSKYGLEKGSRMIQVYDHNDTDDLLEWEKGKSEKIERPETHEALKRKVDQIKKQQKEIDDLKNQLKKKTEIDNFVMDSLGLIAKEMIQNQGVEAIKEIFRKHNVPLVED